jgi:PadR family transcriptional regulator PadR
MGKGENLGELEYLVVIALLRVHQSGEEAYGMAVLRELHETAGRKATIGAVYGTLDRLEEKGLVGSWKGDPDPVKGGKARRYFRVEPAGYTALAETRATMDRMWDGVEMDPGPESAR